jgi:hypothetical protein
MGRTFFSFLAVLALGGLLSAPAEAQSCKVPTNLIFNGGPGRDGIPALTNPEVVTASEGDRFLVGNDLVLGVVVNGEARAYPHGVLWWHEIVNDVLGGKPIMVTFCPLTGSGIVFDPVMAGNESNFGVSGLLFENNLVMFDRRTESLWSQMGLEAICGDLIDTKAKLLPVVQSTWAAWKALHPRTTVVSFNTGFNRNYTRYPYGTYDQVGDNQLLFPESFIDPRRDMKELVLGLTHGAQARAYPYLEMGNRAVINDEVGGKSVLVVFDRQGQVALAFDRKADGKKLTFELATPGSSRFPFQLTDNQTGSTWDLDGQAVDGPMNGAQLTPIATFSAMWFAWAELHRGTQIYLGERE